VEVVGLVATVAEPFDRIAMHGVRRELAQAQARAAGLALELVPLPHPCANETYERAMRDWAARARAQGVRAVAFGDLFLADVRAYRERLFAGTGLAPRFPLWGRDTAALAREMIGQGLRAILACVDPRRVPADWAGRSYDAALLAELPAGVDPCAENGEFHTFAYAGPMYEGEIAVRVAGTVVRDGFVYAELLPAA